MFFFSSNTEFSYSARYYKYILIITVWYKIRNTTINIWPIFMPRTHLILYLNARYLKYLPETDLWLFNANLKTLLTIRFSLLQIHQINFGGLFSNIIFHGKQLVITGNELQWVSLGNFQTFLIAFLHAT